MAGVHAEQDLPEDVARLGLLEATMGHDEVEELATAHLLRGRGRDGARARAGARLGARIRDRVRASERTCSVTR